LLPLLLLSLLLLSVMCVSVCNRRDVAEMKLKLADTFLKLGEIGLETGTPCRIFSVLYNGLTGVPLNLPLSGGGEGWGDPIRCLHSHTSLADMLSATAHHLFGTSYRYPLSIRSLNSFNSFKSRLKTHLFAHH